MKGFANQMKDFGFYPECERNALKWLQQGHDVVRLAVRRNLPAGVAQALEKEGNLTRRLLQ